MKKITTGEYVNALHTLQYIKKEEQEYEKLFHNENSIKHIPQIFETVILSLTKTNDELNRIIKNNIKNFLKDYNYNPKLRDLYKEKIILLIYNFYNNLKESSPLELDSESIVILNNNEKLSFLLDDLKELAKQIYKNNLEINKLKELIKEREISINIKKKFQTQSNDNRKKRKKRQLCK